MSMPDMTKALHALARDGGRHCGAGQSLRKSYLSASRRTAGKFSLRLHRPGYQSGASIQSELAWLTALRRDTRPAHSRTDRRHRWCTAAGAGHRRWRDPLCRAVSLISTAMEPGLDGDLTGLFVTLGGFAAHMHAACHALDAAARFYPAGLERRAYSGRRRALGRLAHCAGRRCQDAGGAGSARCANCAACLPNTARGPIGSA